MYEFFTTYEKDIMVIVITIAVFAVFCWGYFNLAHPTIIVKRKDLQGYVNPCPDLWIFENGICRPSYETKCKPFDPALYKGQECDIVKSCGTSWKGLCR